jgi:hypothetical protein
MKDRIVALDIDDCILSSNTNYFGFTDDNIKMLEVNLIRLRMIVDKYDMKVFITSSWYAILNLHEDNKVSLKYPTKKDEKIKIVELLNEHLGGYFIGLSCGNRETDIIELSKNNKVVILDDWDLSHLDCENVLFCKTRGFIDGNIGFKIKNFFEDEII